MPIQHINMHFNNNSKITGVIINALHDQQVISTVYTASQLQNVCETY